MAMTALYKITSADATAYGGFQYRVGEWTPRTTGKGDLCGPGFYHAYLSPQLALLLNPIHGDYAEPFTLWRAEGKITKRDHELKVGVRSLKLIHEIIVPPVTTEQRVTFAIFCALAVYTEESTFAAWAEAWLSGKDRSAGAAQEAARAATRAARETARAAMWAAREAARAATRVAQEAANVSLVSLAQSALLPWEGK